MTRLAELQRQFQQCLLEPPEDLHQPWIHAGGRADPARQLSAYVHAYAARLKETLAGDYPAVRTAIGTDRFDALAEAYLRARPSRYFSLREFGRDLPGFIAARAESQATPWLGELASFEWTLGLAFDAADRPLADVADMATVAPADWPALRFTAHPSVQRLDLAWNTVALWEALNADEPVPVEAIHGQPVPWLIWRQDLTTRFRSLEPDEAVCLDALLAGASFGELCARLAEYLDPEQVPLRAASLLKGWLQQQLIQAIGTP